MIAPSGSPPAAYPQVPAPVPVAQWYQGLLPAPGELRTAARLVPVLAAAGIPAGLVWLVAAPRREYEVVGEGFRALEPQSEALVGADSWLMVVTGLLGVLAAGLVWRFVRARGAGVVVGLAVGMVLASVVAWQIGEWLGTGSTQAQATQIGAIVAAALQLRAVPVLVIGSFFATLTYLVVVCFVGSDDLERKPAQGSVQAGGNRQLDQWDRNRAQAGEHSQLPAQQM